MIQILMSTFNGEKYVRVQLESLQAQDFSDISILIRDDGSTDSTAAIISNYVNQENRFKIKFYQGENIGVIQSFFDLLKKSDNSAEYYAFSDQDDYWLNDKLSRAVTKIQKFSPDMPVMYCSRTELVDDSLRKIGKWPPKPRRQIGFRNALVQNIAVGCTIVINKKARDLILKKIPESSNIIMHDWWVYLIISALGKVVYDNEPYVFYRQHNQNAIGGYVGFYSKLVKRIKNFKNQRYKQRYKAQAIEFLKIFGDDLPENLRNLLIEFVSPKSFWERLKYAFSNKVYRHSLPGNIALKILIIINRY